MKKLIFLIGDSGVGKDTAAQYLKEEHGVGIVVSHTTREMREGEQQGREHIFIHMRPDTNIWDMCNAHGCHVFAHTVYGDAIYFTTREQIEQTIEESPCKTAVYIIDELGYSQLDFDVLRHMGIHHTLVHIDRYHTLRTGVSPERMERDRQRMHFDRDRYDHHIFNDGGLKELHSELDGLMVAVATAE